MRIMVAYDGSDPAKRALERVATLLGDNDITVLSVVPVLRRGPRRRHRPDDDVGDRRKMLDEAAALLADHGIEAKALEGIGTRGGHSRHRQKEGFDLVAIGPHGTGVSADLRSTTSHVVGHTHWTSWSSLTHVRSGSGVRKGRNLAVGAGTAGAAVSRTLRPNSDPTTVTDGHPGATSRLPPPRSPPVRDRIDTPSSTRTSPPRAGSGRGRDEDPCTLSAGPRGGAVRRAPGPAYIKGFLRTYAEYLGLDGTLFVDEYNSRFSIHSDEELIFPRRRSHPPHRTVTAASRTSSSSRSPASSGRRAGRHRVHVPDGAPAANAAARRRNSHGARHDGGGGQSILARCPRQPDRPVPGVRRSGAREAAAGAGRGRAPPSPLKTGELILRAATGRAGRGARGHQREAEGRALFADALDPLRRQRGRQVRQRFTSKKGFDRGDQPGRQARRS